MKKALSLLLTAVLLVSLTPWAYAAEFQPSTFNIVSDTSSILAPGVTQDIVYARSTRDGNQLVYYLATADVNRPDVNVYANYMGNQWTTWGFQNLTDQMKTAQAIHSNPGSGDRYIPYYNVVAGVNADFYNMSTGQPEGAFVMEGIDINQGAQGKSFFAMRRDGTAVIGRGNDDWAAYHTADNPIVEAVGGGTILVWNGQNAVGAVNDDLNARTMVGLTADGKVVMAVADGKQLPYSRGACMYELAEIMLAAGCVTAINLDGGGSSAYAARPQGGGDIMLVDRPCDGSERQVSSSLMIVSTTPPSDTFARAAVSADKEYITPGSTVNVSATGFTTAETPAEIPPDAYWQLADQSLGTLTQISVNNAVFQSSGVPGDAVIQLVWNGGVIGQAVVHVVVPDRLEFSMNSYTVPYGTSADFVVRAYAGLNEIPYSGGEILLSLSDPLMGTLSGFTFTACEASPAAPSSGTVTATFVSTGLTATANVSMGQGSRVLYDFEDGVRPAELTWVPNPDHKQYNIFATKSAVVTAETGRVHSGSYALALCADWNSICDMGGCTTIQMEYTGTTPIDLTDAVGIGAWVWIPDEYKETNIWFVAKTADNKAIRNTNFSRPKYGTFEEGGHWTYIYENLAGTGATKVEGAFLQFELYASATMNPAEKSAANIFTFYVDDITVDYSSAVPDRQNPVFHNVNLHLNADSSVPMVKGSVTESASGSVMFSANVSDVGDGINPASAEAFVDGQPIRISCQGGTLRTEEVTLAAGVHTLKLGIADYAGNGVNVIRRFQVSANADIPTVRVVPHDPAANNLPLGSIYYVDVIASDVSAIDSVEMQLDLNNISVWELTHADVDPSFTINYSVEDLLKGDNIATVTLSRTNTSDGRTGEAVLASLPIRAWQGDATWSSKSVGRWPRDVSVEVDYGRITYAAGRGNGVFPGFSSGRIQADTEINAWGGAVNNASSWHKHTPGTATTQTATCTVSGYIERVFCTVCGSPLEWGTALPATGHHWVLDTEDKLSCSLCPALYTGEYNGISYVDGSSQEGWVGESYYRGGVKLTGVQLVDDKYYDFGENGVCTGKQPYSGFFTGTDGQRRYAELGSLKTGWFDVGEERFHTGEDGILHTVTATDNRTCVVSNTITYTCSCGEKTESELLWFEGHNWDANHVCTKCGYHGHDIANATLQIAGKYFTYTGKQILAAHTATYNGRELIIRGDKTGLDGYVSYSNNVDIGTATLTIRGECNFYGELIGTFDIVPASVTELTATQQGERTLVLDWPDALGAEYYTLQQKTGSGAWTQVKDNISESTYTIEDIPSGNYTFRVASRAIRNGKVYGSTDWSPEASTTIQSYFQINSNIIGGGSLVISPAEKAMTGETVTFTVSPEVGYQVKVVLVRDSKGNNIAVTSAGGGKYTFTMPAADVTVNAGFNAQGSCTYKTHSGPYQAQLAMSDLLSGRTYVCQMQKADARGKVVGCAAIVVFKATGSTHLLDVLPNPDGYIVSIWLYPESGVIDNISQLSEAFYGQWVK